MAVNGKNKGSSYERKIANMLSARFEPLTGLKSSFRRNTDSGSFFGGSNKRRTETHNLDHANFGDLVCPNAFKFSVECKHYKEAPSFASIVKGKVTQWDTWLAQARQDATSSNKQMMLIVRYNGIDDIVFLEAPISSIRLILLYTTVYVYKLEDVLSLDDKIFFAE